jgi:hypothetical protein
MIQMTTQDVVKVLRLLLRDKLPKELARALDKSKIEFSINERNIPFLPDSIVRDRLLPHYEEIMRNTPERVPECISYRK